VISKWRSGCSLYAFSLMERVPSLFNEPRRASNVRDAASWYVSLGNFSWLYCRPDDFIVKTGVPPMLNTIAGSVCVTVLLLF